MLQFGSLIIHEPMPHSQGVLTHFCYLVPIISQKPALTLIPLTRTLSALALSMAVLQNTPRQTGALLWEQQQPTTKARHEHRGQRPNGNKRLHGVGRPRRPDHSKGANSPAKNQPTPQKRKPRGQRPKQTKPNPEGRPTKARQPQRVCKWARPMNRKVTRTMIQTSTSHGWTRDQSVSCTWTNQPTNQPCTASMSQTWFVTTQPYREDKNSARLGILSILQGRRGHSHAIWSNVPSSLQPSQMHMVEGRWGIRPPRAAGWWDSWELSCGIWAPNPSQRWAPWCHLAVIKCYQQVTFFSGLTWFDMGFKW